MLQLRLSAMGFYFYVCLLGMGHSGALSFLARKDPLGLPWSCSSTGACHEWRYSKRSERPLASAFRGSI